LRDSLAVFATGAEVARDFGTIGGAEAVGKTANIDITRWCTVGIVIFAAGVLVGPVAAVLDSVAEKSLLKAVAIAAGQVVVLTDRLVCAQQRLHFALPGQLVTVVHRVLPVASLFLEVECEAGRAADGLEAGACTLNHIPAVLFPGRQPE
jgi:hypothetical protein